MILPVVQTPRASGPWTGIEAVLEAAERVAGVAPCEVAYRGGHSNHVTEVRFPDGRTLLVKRPRYYPETAAGRFANARHAAALLRDGAGVVAPEHLDLSLEDGVPTEAYWRIPLPTLQEVWPGIPEEERPATLRSWGTLLRRIHSLHLPGSGTRAGAGDAPAACADSLRADLGGRLVPAIEYGWPAAYGAAQRLLATLGEVEPRMRDAGSVLVHGDLHIGNVLCEREGDAVRCVGVIDLEEACAGPPEADWATTQLLHRPLFCQPLPEGWTRHLAEAYGRELDPVILAFFRANRLLNIGFHAAVTGLEEHAEEVASAVAGEVELLASLLRPRVRVAAMA